MTLPATVIFDLDGTLVDTGPDLTAALNHALSTLGRRTVSEPDVRDMVGQGVLKLLERGLAATGEDAAELRQQLMPIFLDYYTAHIADGSRPYPGVERAMDALAQADVRLAVCTNKNEGLSRALIDALGWSSRFGAVVGGDTLPVKKPDPEHLLATIRMVGGDPATSVFVGDTHFDADTAHAAGIPFVAVRFGFAHEPVETLRPAVILEHYDELVAALHGLVRIG